MVVGAPIAAVSSRGLAAFLVLALVAGELYGFLATANWHVAHIEERAAPIHDAEAKRKAAQDWLARGSNLMTGWAS